MKFYVIIYVDSKNEGSVITKGYYESYSEAETNLTNHALEFVRLDGGERQEKITLQNGRSLNEIKLDTALNNGIYLQEVKKDEGEKTIIHVYEKTIYNTGYIFSSVNYNINKIGMFTITEIDFDVPERFSCGCNTKRTNSSTTKTSMIKPPNTFLDELKNLLDNSSINSNFGLKPVKKSKTLNESMSSIVNDISRSV